MGIEKFDDEFSPVVPGRTPNVDSLADGEYILEISEAELVTTRYTGDDIVRWVYKIVDAPDSEKHKVGTLFEKGSLLRAQDDVNRLGAELMSLGIACGEWSAASGKPFSKMLPVALTSLKSVTVQATKSSYTGKNGKLYHNLNVRSKTNLKKMPSDMPF